MKAADKLKWALELDTNKEDNIKSGNYYLINGNYTSSGRGPYSGTADVSLAFETAVEAFKETRNPKNLQVIIFFSGGCSQIVDSQRRLFHQDYLMGENAPCTFTVFFTRHGKPIPYELKIMTENIKANRYSSLNEFSNVLRTSGETASYLDELQCFIKRVYYRYVNFRSSPMSMTINNITTTDFDKDKAYFETPFASLNKKGELELDISFTFKWYPLWNHPQCSLPFKFCGKNSKDKITTRKYNVKIIQSSSPDIDTCNCWYQGRIAFFSESYELKETVELNQKDMEIRFYPPYGEHAPPIEENSVTIELSNRDRSDKLELTLKKQGKYYGARFTRAYGREIKCDEILQNPQERDSIIAIYRNPDIPLDTLSYGIPVRSSAITALKNRQQVYNAGQRYTIIGLVPKGVNPYDRNNPEKHIIPSRIMEILKKDNAAEIENNAHPNTGMLLRVIPQFAETDDMTAVTDFFLEGKVTIFDPVGNTVIREREMGFHENTKSLNFVWNGRNDSYRSCGAGSYLVLFKVSRSRGPYRKNVSQIKNVSHTILKLLVAIK